MNHVPHRFTVVLDAEGVILKALGLTDPEISERIYPRKGGTTVRSYAARGGDSTTTHCQNYFCDTLV